MSKNQSQFQPVYSLLELLDEYDAQKVNASSLIADVNLNICCHGLYMLRCEPEQAAKTG